MDEAVDHEFLQKLKTRLKEIDQLSLPEIEERNKKFFETFGSFGNYCKVQNEKLEGNPPDPLGRRVPRPSA